MLKVAENLFSVLTILFFSDIIFSLLSEQEILWPKILVKIAPYLIQVITILLIIIYRKKILPIIFKEKFLWIYLLITLASAFWSDYPGLTLKRFITITQMTSFGIYFVGRYSLREQLNLLSYSFGIAALISLLFSLVFPSYGIMGMGIVVNPENAAHLGAWRGAFTHKNGLGRMMALAALIFLLLPGSDRRKRVVGWAGLGLSFSLILLSTSKTSLVILITLIALFPLYKAIRWPYTVALPFLIGTIFTLGSITVFLLSNAETLAGALGRDLTLTGRTKIWEIVLVKIGERPLLGYGYAGFWHGMEGESADVWTFVRWACPHAHNGFLDLTLDLGLLGLLAFLITFMTTLFRSIMLIRNTKTNAGIFPLMYLTFTVLVNLTESTIVRLSSMWILFVIVVLSTHCKNEENSDMSGYDINDDLNIHENFNKLKLSKN